MVSEPLGACQVFRKTPNGISTKLSCDWPNTLPMALATPTTSYACEPARMVLPMGSTLVKPSVLARRRTRSEEHTSELQSLAYLVCRLLLEKKKKITCKTSIVSQTGHSD